MATRRREQAMEEIREALLLEPENPQLLATWAYLLWASGDLFDAEEAARRAIFRAPDYAVAHWCLAKILSYQGRDEEALEVLDEAIGLDRRSTYYELSARINLSLGRVAVALDIVKEALFWEPEHEGCLNVYAWVCICLGERPKARELLEKVLTLYPESVEAFSTLGQLERDSGNLVESEKLYREAVELEPDCPKSRRLYENVKRELDQSEHGPLGPFYDPVTNRFLRRI